MTFVSGLDFPSDFLPKNLPNWDSVQKKWSLLGSHVDERVTLIIMSGDTDSSYSTKLTIIPEPIYEKEQEMSLFYPITLLRS